MAHSKGSCRRLTGHGVGVCSDVVEGRLAGFQKLTELFGFYAEIGDEEFSGGRILGRIFGFQSKNFILLLFQAKGGVTAAESRLNAVAETGGEIFQAIAQGGVRRLIGRLFQSLFKGLLRLFLLRGNGIFQQQNAQRLLCRLGGRRLD